MSDIVCLFNLLPCTICRGVCGVCGGVWRQSWPRLLQKESEARRFPPTHSLRILTKENHSPGQMVPNVCEGCPSYTSIYPCEPVLMQSSGLHKNWSTFPPGKQTAITGKAIVNENYHSFSKLCCVKAWTCSRKRKEKKSPGELMKEMGHTLTTKWKRKSYCSPASALPCLRVAGVYLEKIGPLILFYLEI